MKSGNILISGASVAGPALAYWLHRYGFHPTIVERAPAPRPGGQAIDVRGVAREVIERMGLMAQIKQAHTGTRGFSFVNEAGKRVADMGADLLGDSGGVIAEIEILRGDLVRILYEATSNDVEYIFDDSITSISQDENGVYVTFERSAPRQFDLVVGADGLHSNVRKLTFGAEENFVYDLGCYVSIFTVANHLDLDGWELMYSVPGKTVGLYPMRNKAEAKAMFYFAAPPMPYNYHNIEQQKQMLAQAFVSVGWEAPRLLKAMWQASDLYFDRVSQIHMDRWSNGRVALLGDAGYCGSPMGGNGTSMALVGAYVLAGELKAASDYQAAFAIYEHEMRDYVKRCQKFARGGGSSLVAKSRSMIWLRNQSIRMLPYMPWKGLIAGGMQKTANAITLKSY